MKKLVRNYIPSILKHARVAHSHRKLSGDDLYQAFQDKLHEEWEEFWETPNEEELADCLQVLQNTASIFDIDWEKVKVARAAKAEEKGDFSDFIEVTCL
jgi:predicted house-cleaning noncanonical NTP pyrophosphatase (MazG superfamily)